ncbi:TRAP transporter substrate-binding protein [Humitalea sp. 24SJ18S-53]|uniref:TRAP transporter substrate-binding protein n=1 Tax=Humitalea sp. 24SJ18S-53 TaxID=3422307 RepID=UPI003D676CAA
MIAKRTIAATVAVLAAGFFGPAAWSQEPSLAAGPRVTINTITQTLPTLPQYTQVELPIFRERVPAWSNGRVEFRPSTWAESGVTGSNILRVVRQGQAEISAAPLASVAGDVPFVEIADLAGLSPTIERARAISAAVVNASNREMERFGLRIIGTYVFPANVIFCRQPLASLADLAGRKVRTFGPSQNDLVEQLGAQAVSIAFPEVYGALERGVADCAVTAALSGNAAKWFEVTTHMYNLPVSWGIGGYYVSLRWWNSLDPAVRGFVEQVFKRIEDEQWALGLNGTADGVACNIGDASGCRTGTLVTGARRMTVVEPNDADRARVQSILQGAVLTNWVRRCGARCGTQFNEIVAPVVGFRYAGN